MVFPRPFRAALGLSAALAFLAGCSNGASSPAPLSNPQSTTREASSLYAAPVGQGIFLDTGAGFVRMGQPATGPGFMSPEVVKLAKAKQLLYVSVFAANEILIYNQIGKNQKPIGSITGLVNPNGMYIDTSGNLWVANESANDIVVFKPGAKTPFMTLQDPLELPADVIVDTDGTVYVTNLTATNGNPGSVSVYKKGVTKGPSYVITDPNFVRVNSVVLDPKHTLYVTNNLVAYPTGPGQIITFPQGSHGPGTLTKFAFKYAGDEHFDNTGDLLVSDLAQPSVDVFELPNTKARMIPQTGEPYRFAFNHAVTSFFISHILAGSESEVDQVAYPKNALLNKITNGFTSTNQPVGIATSPTGPGGD